jgi:predicted MPP superfamily phosphohydrolase
VEPYWLKVEQVSVSLPHLPEGAEGLRIVQLSDLHLGPYVSLDHVATAIQTAITLQPDLFVLTGDFVSRSAAYLKPAVDLLRMLHAPLGTYAVLGNHDHWTNPHAIQKYLIEGHVQVLSNRALRLADEGRGLWLAGVDDVWERRDDLHTALADVPAEACVLALVHEPDFVEKSAQAGITLQLSGHSHGGQVRLPLIGALVLPYLGRRYPIGLQRAGDTWVYTSRGIGVIYPPIRLNCPPEITLLTLHIGKD